MALDEVTENGVVFDLEALDARALDLPRLQIRDPLSAERRGIAEFIEFGEPAFTKHAAFFDLHRRFIDDGALDFRRERGEVVEAMAEMAQKISRRFREAHRLGFRIICWPP